MFRPKAYFRCTKKSKVVERQYTAKVVKKNPTNQSSLSLVVEYLSTVKCHPRWVDDVEDSNPVAFPVPSQSGIVSPALFNHNDPHVGDGVVCGVKVGCHRFLNSLQLNLRPIGDCSFFHVVPALSPPHTVLRIFGTGWHAQHWWFCRWPSLLACGSYQRYDW